MTTMNICGSILFILIITVGSVIKWKLGKQVGGLEGLDGVFKKKEEYKKGGVVGVVDTQ